MVFVFEFGSNKEKNLDGEQLLVCARQMYFVPLNNKELKCQTKNC